MAANFNRVIIAGNATRDPELRTTPAGTAVANLGIAINSKRKGPNGDWVEETTFVDVTFWSRDAEIAGQYVTKGTPLLVEGRLKLDTWEKDGRKNSKLSVVCERLVLLGGGRRSQDDDQAGDVPTFGSERKAGVKGGESLSDCPF